MKGKKLLAAGIILCILLTGCGTSTTTQIGDTGQTAATDNESTQAEDAQTSESTADNQSADENVPETDTEEIETAGEKQVVVYFANWYLGERAGAEGGEVASIAWDNVTYINHAFWAVAPADGSTKTSVEQRTGGEGARTEFTIISTAPDQDYMDTAKSEINPDMERNHFAEYAAYSELYPDVNIMISIGGWSACGYFSEMAYTPEGRQSFIQSCLDLMDQYPWIDGIDIDWEYPGGSRDGERAPESENDQGCPIFGTAAEDSTNFAALLSELRAAMDEHYGTGVKKLTACASASTGWTLPMQDWAAFAPHLDMINIMTYDLAGLWDGVTGEASSCNGAKAAALYFKDLGIGMDKLCIGTPMYATAYLMKEINPDKVLGAPIEDYKPNSSEIDETMIRAFASEAVSGYNLKQEEGKWVMGESFDNGGTGWHLAYNPKRGSAYMYNDDEASPYYKWFLSYENELSLQEKLDYINKANLAGIIVWESSQDTHDHLFISQMADNLLQ